jgi:hypothetical protein
MRIAFTAEHEEHGIWYLPCEVDTATMPVSSWTMMMPRTNGVFSCLRVMILQLPSDNHQKTPHPYPSWL